MTAHPRESCRCETSSPLSSTETHGRAACREGSVQLHLGDGRSLPLEDDVADVALTAHTIYFMDDPQLTASEVARVISQEGGS